MPPRVSENRKPRVLKNTRTKQNNQKALLTHPLKMPFFFLLFVFGVFKNNLKRTKHTNFSIKIQDRLPQFYMKSSRFPFRDTQSKQTTMVTFHDETVFQKGFHASARS